MKTPLFYLAIFLFVISCKKQEIVDPPLPPNTVETEKVEDYSLLEIGNYWVYQRFSIYLETGETNPLNQFDSLYVKNELVVDNQKYFQLKGTWFGLEFNRLLRNDGERLISSDGKVFFSTTDLPDTLEIQRDISNPMIDSSFTLLLNENIEVESPIGNFESAFQFENKFYLNPSIGHEYLIRDDTEYYVKDLGVVKYTSFYSSPTNLEMRLVRTNVEF